MSQEIEREGDFRGRIIGYEATESKQGAVGVSLEVACDEIFHEGEWCDWTEYEVVVHSDIWVIKKDGGLNKRQAELLIEHAGWDGSFTSIVQRTWHPTPIGFDVKSEKYNGKDQYRIGWIKSYDETVFDENKAKALDMKLGSQMRAIAGNKSRAEEKAEGAPSKPNPGPKAKEKPAAKSEPPAADAPPSDEIPF